ncbi:hypothetical protein D3C80_1069100 [compost metagenome]
MQKIVTNGRIISTTDYLGGFQYLDGVLSFLQTSEGYVHYTPETGFDYVYNYTDHLGNIRLSYTKDPYGGTAPVALEQHHYYPFGMKHEKYNVEQYHFVKVQRLQGYYTGIEQLLATDESPYKYRFNGQEFQNEHGLNTTAMDFRQYDSAIGRFNGMDALSEMQYSHTPYHLGYNNPNFWADPTGLLSDNFINSIWNNSASSGWTIWTNSYNGYFSDNHGRGTVDSESGIFTASISLRPVEITIDRNNWGAAGALAQMHVYRNSPYYDSFWADSRKRNMDSFQSDLDALGVIDPTGIIDGLNALTYGLRGQKANATIAALGILPFGDLAKGVKYTKSTMKIGQEMHKAYKVADEVAGVAKKEFRLPSGKRIDFLDLQTNTIFELKPFNPRAMKAGQKQLDMYKRELESMPEFKGTIWKTVLDTY